MRHKHSEFRIFVEGGDKGVLAGICRRSFGRFFENAGLGNRKPRIVACGTRRAAYEDFCHALSRAGEQDVFLLLVDSESALSISSDKDTWEHVKARMGDGWKQPANATPEMLHFMVQCMESWFLADAGSLEKYFGQGFNKNALPVGNNIELIDKTKVYAALERATSCLKTKRPYSKGEHSFALLERINPYKVEAAGKYAKRVIDAVRKISNRAI